MSSENDDIQDAENFGRWAFGDDYHNISNYQNAWNKLHSNELELFNHGLIYVDMKKMIELWKEYKKDNLSNLL